MPRIDHENLVGRGRSATVLRDVTASGRTIARKVFDPDAASRLVFLVLQGASNPYAWSLDAVRTAVWRRRVLARLLPLWFGDRVRLPEFHAGGWNTDHRAFELVTELVRGRPVPLVGPRGVPACDPLTDLVEGVMRPLTRHLETSGFDGLVWQAGRGNPVAASNFLLESADGEEPRWVWVDLESGVPAHFALDPRAHASFYLPRALALRRPLFDDVDVPRLRSYLEARETELEVLHGVAVTSELRHAVDRLEFHQRRWKGLSRLERSLLEAVTRGRITPEEACRLRHEPGTWMLRRTAGLARSLATRAAALSRRATARLRGVRWRRLARAGTRFFTSQRYRALLGRRYVSRRLRSWEGRGGLDAREAGALRGELKDDETSAYVTDFGVHLLVKPFVKALQWTLVPLLLLLGAADVSVAAFLLVASGSLVRTLYTTGRMAQAAARGRPRPWVALAVGTLPVLGNAAYPAQLVSASLGRDGRLARFLMLDTFSAIGRRLPIWGGADTLTEHWWNRLPLPVLERAMKQAEKKRRRAVALQDPRMAHGLAASERIAT